MSTSEPPPPPPPPPVFETFDDYDAEPGPPRRSSSHLVLWIVLGAVVLLLLLGGGAWLIGSQIRDAIPKVQEIGVRAQMMRVARTVDEYELTEGELPGSLDELLEARKANGLHYLHFTPRDPWGRLLRYRLLNDGRSYELRSAGADGRFETDDDIVYGTD